MLQAQLLMLQQAWLAGRQVGRRGQWEAWVQKVEAGPRWLQKQAAQLLMLHHHHWKPQLDCPS